MSDSPTVTTSEPTGQGNAPLPPTGQRGSLPAVVLFGIALLMAVVTPLCTRDAPLANDVVTAVAAKVREGSGRAFVLVHPPWRVDVEDALEKELAGRNVGLALPPDAMEGKRPVVVVHWPHAPAPGAVNRFTLEREDLVGDVAVRFYNGASKADPVAAPPAPTTEGPVGAFALPGSLRSAQVRVLQGSRTIECNAWDPSAPRWVCPSMNEWNFVGQVTLPVGGEARRCLWAHPTTDATLRITFPNVSFGRVLRFSHGLRDGAAGIEGASDVDVNIAVGGTPLAVKHPNEPGWRIDEIPTAAGKSGDVVLDVTAAHDGARHFCIWLEVVP